MTMHKYAKISTVIITLGPLILPNCPTKLQALVQRGTQMPRKVLEEDRQHQPGSVCMIGVCESGGGHPGLAPGLPALVGLSLWHNGLEW